MWIGLGKVGCDLLNPSIVHSAMYCELGLNYHLFMDNAVEFHNQ